jgi:hypothetical protein
MAGACAVHYVKHFGASRRIKKRQKNDRGKRFEAIQLYFCDHGTNLPKLYPQFLTISRPGKYSLWAMLMAQKCQFHFLHFLKAFHAWTSCWIDTGVGKCCPIIRQS